MAVIDFGVYVSKGTGSTVRRNVPRDKQYGEYFFAGREVTITREQPGSYVLRFDGRVIGSRSSMRAAQNLAVDRVHKYRADSAEAAFKRAQQAQRDYAWAVRQAAAELGCDESEIF